MKFDIDLITKFLIEYGTRILGATIIFVVGLWLVRIFSKSFSRFMEKKNFDPSLKHFLKSFVITLLRILLLVIVLTKLGVEMSSFVAMLAAAGLAIGMALSGTLQNFAGGIVILIFRPFKVGDFIDAQGHKGTVTEIHIFTTVMLTIDNKTVIIPNGALSNNAIVNYSKEPLRRVDITVGIAYGDDLGRAQEVLKKTFAANPKILNNPQPPFIEIEKLNDSSVDLTVRVWCNNQDYWDVFFFTNAEVYKQFTIAHDITIPFPQMDVHLHNSK